jgi:hypothetical protein
MIYYTYYSKYYLGKLLASTNIEENCLKLSLTFNVEPTILVHGLYYVDVANKSQKDHKRFRSTYILCNKKNCQQKD